MAEVPYNPAGEITATFTPNQAVAHPDAFGGQIGEAMVQGGAQVTDVAQKVTGMLNETAANQTEVSYIKGASELKSKYMQLEGSAAVAAQPQYEKELNDLRETHRASLTGGAVRMFDANTMHFTANQSAEYGGYAAGQAKKANLDSHEAIANLAIASMGDINNVLDDSKFANQKATVTYSANAIADVRSWTKNASGIDTNTGEVTFSDTPEGQASKAQYTQYKDGKAAELYLQGLKTISEAKGAGAAADWYKQKEDDMPDMAKAEAMKYLAPKIKSEAMASSVSSMNTQIQSDYAVAAMKNVPNSLSPSNAASPLDVIRKNEGVGYSKDNKGEVVNGINSLAFPKEFSEAKQILDTQGQAAATKYADNFYQKQIIEKNGIDKLPAATQAIVADGLVNHGAGDFGQSLVTAAKNGASPQQLIDMRRVEYQRLNDTGKPEYVKSFADWNRRLDSLQQQNGNPINKVDVLKENEDAYVQHAVNAYTSQFDDENGAKIVERRARNDIQAQIKQEDTALKADQSIIEEAISGKDSQLLRMNN